MTDENSSQQEQPSVPLVTFPAVLKRLDFQQNLKADEYRRLEVDGLQVLRAYCQEMTLGMAYEQYVQSDENLSNPHTLTRGNFKNSRRVHSLGWSYIGLADLMDQHLPQLDQIPPDADMFLTDAYDGRAIDILVWACTQFRGINVANATKLLYQKRPRLIPIVDRLVRQAFNIHYIGGYAAKDYRAAFELSFQRFREVSSGSQHAVDRIMTSISTDRSTTGGLLLSRARVLDVLGWSVVRQMGD